MSRRDRWTLGAIVVAGFALRVWWSGAFAHPALSDPDGYADMSRLLVGPHGWHWTRRAVQFAEFTKAPLYQVLLSGLWRLAGGARFVAAALVTHAALNALTPVALYIIATRLHNRHAGLLAAMLYAVWAPNILPTGTLWQEQLFIPAACWAMASTAIAMDDSRDRSWLLAGAMFGGAALTRSSITYFVLPAAAVVAASARPRSRAIREAALLLAGFAALVLPYVLYISSVTGRPTFIESVGYFSLKRFEPVSAADPRINLLTMLHDPAGPPTTTEVLRFLARDVAAAPGAFVLRRLEFVRLLVKPGGPAFLANTFVATRASALAARAVVHVMLDLAFVGALTLAPLGVVLARRRRLALLLALWPPLYLALVALMLWAGTRYRAPVEPVLLVLAAVVLVGNWVRPGWRALAAAVTATVACAALVAVSVPSIPSARANYGVTATPVAGGDLAFDGAMGAFVSCQEPALAFSLRAESPGPVAVTVWVDGKRADAFSFSGSVARRYRLDGARRVYLEIAAAADDSRARLVLHVD